MFHVLYSCHKLCFVHFEASTSPMTVQFPDQINPTGLRRKRLYSHIQQYKATAAFVFEFDD